MALKRQNPPERVGDCCGIVSGDMRYLLLALVCALHGCATAAKVAHQEHAQIYCLAGATRVPFTGTVARAHCSLAWGAPWSPPWQPAAAEHQANP